MIKNLYQPSAVHELEFRLSQLRQDSPRQWGKMTPAQALAHYSAQMEMVLGERFPPRQFMGRLFGRFAKPGMLGERPLRRNMPTDQHFIVIDERDLEVERKRVQNLIAQFIAAGPAGCTRHPHSFLGRMNPLEWATLMYKHLDHHLRQFAV